MTTKSNAGPLFGELGDTLMAIIRWEVRIRIEIDSVNVDQVIAG
jgi:hypothetical protein